MFKKTRAKGATFGRVFFFKSMFMEFRAILNLFTLKLIAGVFGRSYCCYGIVCHKNDNFLPVTGQFLCTMIVASTNKEWQYDTSKVLETVLSYLN